MPELLSLHGLDDHAANYSLECMCKSMAEPPAGDGGIWNPHHTPVLQTLIEAFTQVGLLKSKLMMDELGKWLSGTNHTPGTVAFPGVGPVWPAETLPKVGAYLASKSPASMMFGDWMMLVDYLLQTAMPPEWAAAQGEWLAVRSAIMGKLELSVPGVSVAQADNALASLPNTVAQASSAFALPVLAVQSMGYAAVHAAEAIVSLTDAMRHRMKAVILEDMESWLGHGSPGSALQTKLFDAFGDLNRDWRRIALTEAGEAKNQGFVAGCEAGARLRRVEMYNGACSFCRAIDGKVFDVVSPGALSKDGKTQVWVGKTNYGRSASPRKMVGGMLAKRLESELWWPAAGVQHPHCRGSWVRLGERLPWEDAGPRWAGWIQALGLDE